MILLQFHSSENISVLFNLIFYMCMYMYVHAIYMCISADEITTGEIPEMENT